MEVEETVTRCCCERVDQIGVTAFGKVQHAFEHPLIVARRASFPDHKVASPYSWCSLMGVTVAPLLAFLEGPELIIVLVVILVLFGGAKLPQLARSIGQAQKEFKKGLTDDDDDKSSKSDNSDKA